MVLSDFKRAGRPEGDGERERESCGHPWQVVPMQEICGCCRWNCPFSAPKLPTMEPGRPPLWPLPRSLRRLRRQVEWLAPACRSCRWETGTSGGDNVGLFGHRHAKKSQGLSKFISSSAEVWNKLEHPSCLDGPARRFVALSERESHSYRIFNQLLVLSCPHSYRNECAWNCKAL